MKKQEADFTELVKKHIQSIDETAEIMLLFPQGKRHEEAIQIYVLTAGKVTFETEQSYFKACYQLELASCYNFSIYIPKTSGTNNLRIPLSIKRSPMKASFCKPMPRAH